MFVGSPLSSRNQFGKYLTDKGLTGRAVEVGTHRGEFARVLLLTWKGSLTCVDPWDEAVGDGHLVGRGVTREDDYRAAEARLGKFGRRVELVRLTSAEAAPLVPDSALDFVYVDGDHSYEAVLQDLTLWWPKLRPGGVLAGHDWLCPGEENGGWGGNVQSALDRFLQDLWEFQNTPPPPVSLIVEEGGLPWSFHLEKTNADPQR